MKIITESPRRVREIENLFIELGDGCKLAARVWLPEDAEIDPVPAILEYLPYRKRDGTSQRDVLTHPYLAGHGYACLRVDMRGNGESDGLMRRPATPPIGATAASLSRTAVRPILDGRRTRPPFSPSPGCSAR
jgi:uncharacterized protein